MTEAEADRVAHRWTGYAVTLSRDVPRPETYTVEDWHAEALLGLAQGLRRWKPRPGFYSGAGAPARYLKRAILGRLWRARRFAISGPNGLNSGHPDHYRRTEFTRALRLEGPAPGAAVESEPETLHDTTPDPGAVDPLARAIEADLLDRLREASAGLSEPHRQTLGLTLRGFRTNEIAETLGVSRQTVLNRMRSIRETLRPVFA